MDKNRDLRRLAKGQVPTSLEDKPFAVIRYNVRMIFINETSYQYAIALSGDEKDLIPVDRRTAHEIINANAMELAYSGSDGKVYEMPGAPFHKKWAKTKKYSAAS